MFIVSPVDFDLAELSEPVLPLVSDPREAELLPST